LTAKRYDARLSVEVISMAELAKRSTIYFEPSLHHALRIKAAHTHRSVSELVNDAVREALREDQEDLAAFDERRGETTISYEELLKDLKAHGKI
jgi:plasmid stability protein